MHLQFHHHHHPARDPHHTLKLISSEQFVVISNFSLLTWTERGSACTLSTQNNHLKMMQLLLVKSLYKLAESTDEKLSGALHTNVNLDSGLHSSLSELSDAVIL